MKRSAHFLRRSPAVHVSARFYLLLAAIILTGEGCVPAKVTVVSAPGIERYDVKTVVVVPFESVQTPQLIEAPRQELPLPQGAKRSEIEFAAPPLGVRLDRPTVTVPSYAAEKVTQIVYKKLLHREGLRVLPPDAAAQAPAVLRSGEGSLTSEQRAQRIAAHLSADAAVLGRVSVYRERVGSKIGADPPAVVGFEVKLVAADGKTLWVGSYYERQRPMNEDLVGFLQRGGVFVRAEELADYGAEQLIRQFPFGGESSRHAQ